MTRIGDSALYAPAKGLTWLFLLWDVTDPPPSIPLTDTWSEQGSPARLGWYVFVSATPDRAHAAGLERALRDALPVPVATGLAWVGEDAGSGLDLRGAVAVRSDDQGRPVVAADAPITLPPELLTLGFLAGMRLALRHEETGEPNGVIATRPAYDDQPWTGVVVPLTGSLAGCLTLTALLESTVEHDHSTKLAADVRVDPLRPFDPERTRISPTGAAYALIAETDKTYRLLPVPAGRSGEDA